MGERACGIIMKTAVQIPAPMVIKFMPVILALQEADAGGLLGLAGLQPS